MKHLLRKISQNLKESTPANERCLFWVKSQSGACTFTKEGSSSLVLSNEFWEIFQNTLNTETFQVSVPAGEMSKKSHLGSSSGLNLVAYNFTTIWIAEFSKKNYTSSTFPELLLLDIFCYCFVLSMEKNKDLIMSSPKKRSNETINFLHLQNKKYIYKKHFLYHAWHKDQNTVKAGKLRISYIVQMSFTVYWSAFTGTLIIFTFSYVFSVIRTRGKKGTVPFPFHWWRHLTGSRGEWPSGLRHWDKNRKRTGSNPTWRSAGLRDPTLLPASWWSLGRKS